MLTGTGSGWLLSCDFCSNETKIDTKEMTDALDQARRKGWRVTRSVGGTPLDRCPCCVEDAGTKQTAPLRLPSRP